MVPDVVSDSQSDEEDTLIESAIRSSFNFEFASTSSSFFGSAIISSSHGRAASSNEATSAGDIQVPQSINPAPVAEELNRWCVEAVAVQ